MKAIGIKEEIFDQRDNTRIVTYELENQKTAEIRYDRYDICLVSRELMEILLGLPKKEGE